MDPELWEVVEATGPAEVQAIIRLTDVTLMPAGVRMVAQFGDIITCRLPRDSIIEVRTSAATASMKPPIRLLEEPDPTNEAQSVEEVASDIDNRRPAIEQLGKGCVVGVVDWGIDFAHGDFRDANGRSRLMALWDQRNEDHHPPNNRYGYGHVYAAEDINRALMTADPYAALGYRPWDVDPEGQGTHGTHVAGIAAGNGRAGSPSGIAPEAEIIFVHLASEGPAAMASLGNSVTLLEAIDFIATTAGERPWVVNLSMGQQGGSHDGTSLVEQALDNVVSEAPGRAIVQSCGNYFDRRIHASGELRPGEQKRLRFQVDATELIPNKVEIWYSKRDTVEVAVHAPDGTSSSIVSQGERDVLTRGGQPIGKLYHRANDPNNGNHQVALVEISYYIALGVDRLHCA